MPDISEAPVLVFLETVGNGKTVVNLITRLTAGRYVSDPIGKCEILLATQRYLPLYWAKLGCPCSINSFKHLGVGSSAPANPEQFASPRRGAAHRGEHRKAAVGKNRRRSERFEMIETRPAHRRQHRQAAGAAGALISLWLARHYAR